MIQKIVDRLQASRGSFVVAGAFFAFFFLLIAAFGIDLSRYFLKRERVQEVADSAALAGANWFNQVKKIDEVDTGKVREIAFKKIVSAGGYEEDAYEINKQMQSGDIQFHKFPPDAHHPDTYFRIGVNVKQAFEPYFMPRQVFGDDPYAVQAQAVAEVDPHFSSNYYPNLGGPKSKRPLRFGIHSKGNIKPENMDCFIVNGDLHSDEGSIVLEGVTGNGCGAGVDITGSLEAGDPNNLASSCGGPSPSPGCIRLENLGGSIDGRAVWATGYSSDGTVTPSEGDINAAPGDFELQTPPPPDEEPDQYNEPICNYDVSGGTHTISDFDNLGDCSDGGTINVMNGGLKVSDSDMAGDYTLVADGQVKFSGVGSLNSHDMFIYSVNRDVKFENIDSAEINASIYAPDATAGKVKWENSSDITINGGLLAGNSAKVEANGFFKINYDDKADLMPGELTTPKVRNDIPDYYTIKLID